MKLIVGLGNPEERYAGTRHNLGFEVVDEFLKKIDGGKWKMEGKFKAEVTQLNHKESEQIILAKPQTFMNKSGLAVKLLTTYYKPFDFAQGKLPSTNLIVIHDELDLPLGKIKVRLGGAAAGHHGVESIINALGTDQFIRLRLGIGNLRTKSGERKGQTISAEKFVLDPFMRVEKSKVKHMIKQAVKALEILLEKGLEYAQNQFN